MRSVLPVSSPLTDRELQTVALIVDGLSNDEISATLGITNRTVQAHLKNAMRKTGTRTRTQLAVHALRSGLVASNPIGTDDDVEHEA